MNAIPISLGGPYFEDLYVGQRFVEAPALTLGAGLAALHQAIVGDRLRLALDAELSRAVIGSQAPLAHPALVWDVAIGQSTLATQRVIANLFYRGLVLRRAPCLGDTLRTTTEVVSLRQNRARPERAATGLAVLRISTVDQADRAVLDFMRCAMLPLREGDGETGHTADLSAVETRFETESLRALFASWRFDAYRSAVPGAHFAETAAGTSWEIEGGAVVSSAPELARLSLNIATAHHDATANRGAERLVYGGHTIGIALAQAAQALPNLVTVAAWHGCDHLAPVREGDTLKSRIEVERVEPLPCGGGLVHLRSQVRNAAGIDVLDWRFVGVMA